MYNYGRNWKQQSDCWFLGCRLLLAAFLWVFLAACFIATGFLAAFFAAFFSVFGPTDEVGSYGFGLVRLSVSQLVREIPLIRIFYGVFGF